jgi:hypothetical protein
MHKTILVETDIADGFRVVEELERILHITAAFWLYVEEEDEWKLIIVSPDVATKGPISLYTEIDALLNKLSVDPHKPIQMPLGTINLVSPNTLLYERVKQFSGVLDTHIYKLG